MKTPNPATGWKAGATKRAAARAKRKDARARRKDNRATSHQFKKGGQAA